MIYNVCRPACIQAQVKVVVLKRVCNTSSVQNERTACPFTATLVTVVCSERLLTLNCIAYCANWIYRHRTRFIACVYLSQGRDWKNSNDWWIIHLCIHLCVSWNCKSRIGKTMWMINYSSVGFYMYVWSCVLQPFSLEICVLTPLAAKLVLAFSVKYEGQVRGDRYLLKRTPHVELCPHIFKAFLLKLYQSNKKKLYHEFIFNESHWRMCSNNHKYCEILKLWKNLIGVLGRIEKELSGAKMWADTWKCDFVFFFK